MKTHFSNFRSDFFKKPDFSLLWERLLAVSQQIKLQPVFSLKSLILLGFVIAVIPLFLAVMYAAFGLRETSALGRTINSQVFEQTKSVRLVMQKTGDIERKAKLFVLLSDPSLRQPYEQQSYESTRAAFKQALSELLKLNIDNKVALLVNELAEKENLIYQQIIGSVGEKHIQLPVDEAFQGFREASYRLSREFEDHVEMQFNALRQESETLEHGLLVKGGVLLIISIIFILLLITLLSRSMKQLDTSIRRLGSGDLQEPIDVDGPSDLRYLGNRLEWLRTHLIELELSKQQFMHNVAREIDQPLASISEGVALLTNETTQEDSDLTQEIGTQLCKNVEQLKKVSQELLRYSQINANLDMKLKQSMHMKDLLERGIENFASQLQAKSISLKKLIKPVDILGVPEQLQSIVEQLLSNAIKFSPTGGEIRIMLRGAGAHMELEIEDEGPGIDPNERSQVFEPFFRSQQAHTEAADSPGLGLAIVKEYVINHQGKVEFIDSRQDQHGARIRVQIPLT